jgi:hypothetical protein
VAERMGTELAEVLRAALTATLSRPPAELGITHWSSRLLAQWLCRRGIRVSHDSISRLWRRFGIQPWRCETFKFSTDPQLEAKIRDVVGLYLNPPDNAIVLSVDEKSQIQASDRTAPMLPMRRGCPSAKPVTTFGTAPPRCSPRWRWPPARSPTPAIRGTALMSS